MFVAGFPYGTERIAFGAGGRAALGVLRFAPAGAPGEFRSARPDGTAVEIVAGSDGGLQSYRHRDGGHVLEIRSHPPRPPDGRVTNEARAAYRVAIDAFKDLVVGTVRAVRRGHALVLDWRNEAPDWARAHPLRTTVLPEYDGVTSIETKPEIDAR